MACTMPGNWQKELDKLTFGKPDILNDFEELNTDADRIHHVFTNRLLSDIGWLKDYFRERNADDELTSQRRNQEKAAKHKEEGNKSFHSKRYQEALQSYTQSMQCAACLKNRENDSPDLAVAFGNRSAVLFRVNKFMDCLKDIERAFGAGSPQPTRYKLLVRRCFCHIRLGHRQTAKEAEREILEAAKGKDCDAKSSKYLEEELKKIQTEIQMMAETQDDEFPSAGARASHPADPSVSYGQNSVLVQASSAVEMKTSASQGRFLQATRDIKTGDTLIVERPYAAILLPPYYSTNCLHCFADLPDNPVGCHECCKVLYCDERCRDESWTQYHSVECRYTNLMHSVGIAHLALRIVLTVGLSDLIEFLSQREKTFGRVVGVPGVTKEGGYERNYLSVYDLMTHTSHMETEDLIQYTLTASLLVTALLHADWFSALKLKSSKTTQLVTGQDLTDLFLQGQGPRASLTMGSGRDLLTPAYLVGGALLRHVQQLVCNAHAITAIRDMEGREEAGIVGQGQVRIATAIYPTASLMNHSCDPTIISSFQKDTLIVKSTKDVPREGEIFNCYGPHCKRMEKKKRQEVLQSQYFFHCRCLSCLTEADEGTAQQVKRLQCCECKGPFRLQEPDLVCQRCHSTVNKNALFSRLGRVDSILLEAEYCFTSEYYEEALSQYLQCLEVYERLIVPDDQRLGQIYDGIAHCLIITGRFVEATTYLERSLRVVEARFGSNAIELVLELRKLAMVYHYVDRPLDALCSVSRALDIMTLLYPESHTSVLELQDLKTEFASVVGHLP